MRAEIDWYQVSLKVLLRNQQGELLVFKTNPEWGYGGAYDIPGGRIDRDEFSIPLTDILRREILEEAGDIVYTLHPEPVAVCRGIIPAANIGADRDSHILYLLYLADYHQGDIAVSEEHQSHEWCKPTSPEQFIPSLRDGIRTYMDQTK